MAARKLGLTEVPVIELAHLTPTKEGPCPGEQPIADSWGSSF